MESYNVSLLGTDLFILCNVLEVHPLGSMWQDFSHCFSVSYTTFPLLIHPSADVGLLQLLAIVNSGYEHGCANILQDSLNFFKYIPQSVIAGSYDSSISKFSRNVHTVFSPLFSPTNNAHTLTNILMDVQWYLMVSICISLMINNVGHFFMFLGHF